MASDPRRAALDMLVQLESSPVTLDHLMEALHTGTTLSPRDIRFIQALVYGVQRWRYRLDTVLDALSDRPPRKKDPRVVNILRLGLYQILEMDRVPEAAVVHTAVELARAEKRAWATGYINAVLRRALREPKLIKAPPGGVDPVQRLAVSQSFPPWMITRWSARFGQAETEALCRAVNRIPPLALRSNALKTTRTKLLTALEAMNMSARSSSVIPTGLLIDGRADRLFESPPYQDGWFQVQDEAAQAVGYLVGARPGETILDACAGLGGKTAHLAECMQNRGRITAVDQDGRKLERLQAEMRRLGIDIVQTRSGNWFKSPPALAGRFDRVLVDAPCSGMGVLRRNPDAKWNRQPKAFKRYRATQRRLLTTLAPLLKPGGIMVYAVCSTEPEETRDVVQWFLKNHPQFAIDREPSSMAESMSGLRTEAGHLQTEVHRHAMDGFFATRLRQRK